MAAATTAVFNHIDTSGLPAGTNPWTKVDADASNYERAKVTRSVTDLRGVVASGDFTTDATGFALLRVPTAATEATFFHHNDNDAAVRGAYYAEVEALLRQHLPDGGTGGKVSQVVIFDHTIRRRTPDAPRAPVQHVHVDQTAAAAAARVRRHVQPAAEAERWLRGRYQIVNVWRPIGHAAAEFPLAVIDWRSTRPEDYVPVDLLYPKRQKQKEEDDDNDDDRGKEQRPDDATLRSAEGYEVRGETMAVLPRDYHRFYYAKDMAPDEVLLLKCYDSHGEGEQPLGRPGVAVRTPHTAFVDPLSPPDAKPRQSIEVRCLVLYE